MSQSTIPGWESSPAALDVTSTLSTLSSFNSLDTGSIYKAPKPFASQNNTLQTPTGRPKRTQHQAQLSFNAVGCIPKIHATSKA
jgi:hypothetical protein